MKYVKILVILIILIGAFPSQKLFAQDNAIFLLSPSSGTYNKGDKFSVDLKLNSPELVTSIKSYLEFNPATLKVENIDSSGGIFSYWWENSFDNQAGKIRLQASAPAPGQKEGLIAKINFQVVKSGQANVAFDASSLALKPSDENILNLTASVGAQFSLLSPSLKTMLGTKTLLVILSGILLVLVIFFLILNKRLIKTA